MAGLRSLGRLTLILSILIYQTVWSSPVNISVASVPASLIQSAINSLNENSPTQHTYRGGNLISAQKLLEPNYVIFRLTLNLETICSEGSTNCPREACTLDIKDTSGDIEINRNSFQCMYLYPQSAQEDVQQVQQPENIVQDIAQAESSAPNNADDSKTGSQNTLELDHEVEVSSDSQRPEAAEKPFIAVRAPSYCAGCPYELNPNLPGLAAFGVQALDMMDRLGHNDFKHKLIRIIKVTRAVPPGSNVVRYKLLTEIGETNCLKTTLIDRSECSLQGNIPVRVCLVTFEERPWQQSDRQVVSNNCTEPSDLENEINAGLNPGLNSNSYLAGNGLPERVDSVQEVIGKTAHIDQLAQEGKIGTYDSLIDQIIENSAANVTQEISAAEIPLTERVESRRNSDTYASARRDTAHETNEDRPVVTEAPFVKVELERGDDKEHVQGFVDKFREFDEFLSDFDIPMRDTVARVTEDNRQAVTEEIIRPQKVGGENVAENGSSSSEEGTSDESTESRETVDNLQRRKRALTTSRTLIEELAQKAVNTLDDIDQDDKKRVVRRILESKKQKIDGFLYHLVLEVALTDCREIDNYESDAECLDKIIGPFKICKVQIHTDEKDPVLSARVVESKCSKESTKGQSMRKRRNSELRGAPSPISIDNEDIQNYANLGLQKFSETSEGTNEPILVEIVSATRQVVAGTLYKIQTRMGTSDCPKGTKENCTLLADRETKECEIAAWVQLWIQKDPVDIKVKCNENARAKRGLRGKNYSQKMLEQSLYMKNERLFNEFIAKYNKSYSSTFERKNRYKIFQQNMMMVQELQRNEQGTAVYGVSMFADLTTEEFRQKYLGLRPELRLDNEIPIPMAEIPEIEIPDEYDWRNYNVVTPVKNQGQCGSCWAFSVTGNVEGQYALRYKTLLSLSEQELVDCDTLDQGCNGGLPDNAYRAIEKLGGLELESDYPYDGENEVCHFNKTEAKVNVVSAVNITSNETQMAQWLVQNGPISIGINANAMQFYMGGVSHPFKFLCSPNNLDHGVLIVGYGTHTYPIFHKRLPYWTIKNSWGPLWGEQGYYRVYRGDGTCGVNQMASSAIVA